MSAETTLPVEFLMTTQLGERGQLTVPSEYRDALRLGKGAQVAVLRLGGALLLIPERAHFRQLCDRIAGVFANVGITEADLLATLPEARQRVFERRYPALAKAEKKRRSKVGKK
ncbi:MAG TPA: AbrB/MazE/SpoVT family DNA-binding domain-containing protein [Blastocatellia bacterium]|nr:AbrB/MazE/SpoVT family DNA-binding domain-containing protein [Blastocatellia bacterium]